MSKNRNLKYQFRNCIEQHFKEGIDKHSLKQTGKKGMEIFSYAQRKNLIDVSSNFANYMKVNYPEIKQVKNITSDHIQNFLNSKINCSQMTLQEYQSQFRKLELLVNSTYNANVNYHAVTTPRSTKNGGGKLRSNMCTEEQYNMLLKTTNNNLRNALQMSKIFGCRASEISKFDCSRDVKVNGINIIDSKGKRSRFVKAETKEQVRLLEELKQKQGRLCPVHTASLQQAFNRECKKQGIFIGENGAFHSLRKLFATEEYIRNRNEGLNVQESLDKVSNRLGHGNNRNSLMKAYICCAIR